ncbi:UNVERIFIED_CONTAM: hypothetical protein GTU68_056377 [Idotea baltica]|nr:hypothetical protein [Idotea baltica]
MSIELLKLVQEANSYLNINAINDYCPNGLQVEGKSLVGILISGVTASQELIDAAIAQQADAIIVHHGYFWKNENPCILGIKRNRLKSLLEHDISLLAYHLPLDLHAVVGNNVQLARYLNISVERDMRSDDTQNIGLIGTLNKPCRTSEFASKVRNVLNRDPMVINGDKQVTRIAWCSGGGQNHIEQAIDSGADLYLTGEASEKTYHIAREYNIGFIAAGHHATERYGVKALGDYLADHFAIKHQFIDCPNPI